jgi:hypothetical protein
MRKLPFLLAGFAFVAAPAVAGPRADPETRLARAVDGRIAGEPVDCISLHTVRSSRVIDAGHTIYVNRPRAGAEALDSYDTLVTRTHGSRLCSIDRVEMLDGSTYRIRQPIFLGEFIPYRRAR